MDLPIATLSRVENGERLISTEDVNALLTLYGVTGPDRAWLLTLARETKQPTWWTTKTDPPSVHALTLPTLEADANRIVHVTMLLVPGLLQTPDYTRTVMMVGGVEPDRIAARVNLRLQRQAILSKPRPPHYTAIIDETVLRRVAGSRATMAAQLDHICTVAERPNVDVRIVPFDQGVHPFLSGNFGLLSYPKAKTLLYLDLLMGAVFVDRPADVTSFQENADGLMRIALGSGDSMKLVRRIAADFRRG